MTIVDIWERWVAWIANYHATSCVPEYPLCLAAYKKMGYRFMKELRDPFSEYHYQIRDLLKICNYMRIFEDCWGWVHIVAKGMITDTFNGQLVRALVLSRVLNKVQDEFEPRATNLGEILSEAFDDYRAHYVLQEEPLVNFAGIFGHPHLEETPGLEAGFCKEFYPELATMTQAQCDARFLDTNSEEDSDQDMEGMEYVLEDVELEAYGAWININEVTLTKQCAINDPCTICQTEVTLGSFGRQRCIGPVDCSDVFHAGCLEGWVNGASTTSNLCPNCQTEITTQLRPRRPTSERSPVH